MPNNKTPYYLLAAAAALAIAGTVTARKQTATNKQNVMQHDNYYNAQSNIPRGYRNNNPLNIRISNSNWLGKVTPNTDGTFEQFRAMEYGFRAAFMLLRTYYNKYGCNTLRKIINRWAPPSENNTSAYLTHVSQWASIDPDKIINIDDPNTMIPIVYAMARSENGYYPLVTDVRQGWNLTT